MQCTYFKCQSYVIYFTEKNLIEEARVLRRGFHLHVRREANQVAHTLAKNALNIDEDLYWVDDCPDCVLPLSANDCNPSFS